MTLGAVPNTDVGAQPREPHVHVTSAAPMTNTHAPSAARGRRSIWLPSRADRMPTERPSHAQRGGRAAAPLADPGLAALPVHPGVVPAYLAGYRAFTSGDRTCRVLDRAGGRTVQ